jgi:hypothetical protein
VQNAKSSGTLIIAMLCHPAWQLPKQVAISGGHPANVDGTENESNLGVSCATLNCRGISHKLDTHTMCIGVSYEASPQTER